MFRMNFDHAVASNAKQEGGTLWTQEEARIFEEKLAEIDADAPDRWAKIAAAVQTKTAVHVEAHYRWLQGLLR